MNMSGRRWHYLASLACLLALVFAQPVTARQNAPVAPALTPEEIKIYEDVDAVSDFGKLETRVVRLAAVKP